MNTLRKKKSKETQNHKKHKNVSKEEIEQISRCLINDYRMLMNDIFRLEKVTLAKMREKVNESKPLNKQPGNELWKRNTLENDTEQPELEHDTATNESEFGSEFAPTPQQDRIPGKRCGKPTKLSSLSSGNKSFQSFIKVIPVYDKSKESLLKKETDPQPSSGNECPSYTAVKICNSVYSNQICPPPETKNFSDNKNKKPKLSYPYHLTCAKCNLRKESASLITPTDNQVVSYKHSKDKTERFTEHLGRKLRTLEPLQRILTERIINEVCSHAKKGRLSVHMLGKLSEVIKSSKDNKEETELVQSQNCNENATTERKHDEIRKPELTNADIDAIVCREKALLSRYIGI